MSSIIKKFTSLSEADDALDNTEFGQKILQGMLPYIKEYSDKNASIQEKLSSLLGIGSLPAEIVNILIRPWHRALSLSRWCMQCDLPEEKTRVKDKIEEIKQIKKSFKNWPKTSLSFMCFMTSKLPDMDRLLSYLEELQEYLEAFNDISFKRGSEYSPEYFERYAINSLFWIGKKIGLKENGKPTQLSNFIKIITDHAYGKINRNHYIFNDGDFVDLFNTNKNTALSFIFDPHDPSINGILNLINTRVSNV
ncbi:hypothetical protein [Legionella nagasakiensis]|uniref:hypothetical protein n=1 Tax=Legionella nagasakiensis TaxID=535290 RepID=UPI001054E652|nr:hypothetical protein [Legionella nagasakiensis]